MKTFMANPENVERNGMLLTQQECLLDVLQAKLQQFFAEKTNQHTHLMLTQVTMLSLLILTKLFSQERNSFKNNTSHIQDTLVEEKKLNTKND